MKHSFLISVSLLICSFTMHSSEKREDSLNESQKSMRDYLHNLSGSPKRTQSPRDESKTESQLMEEMDKMRQDSGGLLVRSASTDGSEKELLSPTLQVMHDQASLIGEVHATAAEYVSWFLGMREQLGDFEGSADLPSVQQAQERLSELEKAFVQMRDNEKMIRDSYREIKEAIDEMTLYKNED